MNHDHHKSSPQAAKRHHEYDDATPSYPKLLRTNTNAWVVFAVVVATILFYLWTHHKRHLLDVLPYLLILAMALMHIFGHGGHGGHGSSGGQHHE